VECFFTVPYFGNYTLLLGLGPEPKAGGGETAEPSDHEEVTIPYFHTQGHVTYD
jgi:hypothetical protein